MLWRFKKLTALPRTSARIPQRPHFSSYPSHNNRTSPSEVKDAPKSFWLHLKEEYPELYQMLRASQGRITKEFYASLQAEPELFLLFREQQSATENKQYATDAKYRAARIAKAHAWYEAHRHDQNLTRRQKIYNWCFCPVFSERHSWTKHLPWTTHRPVAYTKKVSHYCEGCGYRRLGFKAWVSTLLAETIEIC